MTLALSRLNFRDVGGLPSGQGRSIRSGVIYRSEGPASFAPEHHEELRALDIRLVCDLRGHIEREIAPNDWCEPTSRLLNLDMQTDLRAQGSDGWAALRADPSASGARAALLALYAGMPKALAPHLRQVVDAVIAQETPILLHCTAGKDRTGVAIAVLLLALDVPRQAIVADYLRSDVFGENSRISGSLVSAFEKAFGFAPSQATVDIMVGVDPAFLAAALDVIGRDWGSIEAYLAACDIDAARRDAFRRAMIVERAA